MTISRLTHLLLYRIPLISRNAYDIVFRIVELGVALWFPCVLWNCIAPEQLWILNPRKILKIDIDKSVESVTPKPGEFSFHLSTILP